MPSEVDRRLSIDQPDAAFGVHVLIDSRAELLVKRGDRAGKIRIAAELTGDDPQSHDGVGEGSMGAVVLRVAVEPGGGGEVARLP